MLGAMKGQSRHMRLSITSSRYSRRWKAFFHIFRLTSPAAAALIPSRREWALATA